MEEVQEFCYLGSKITNDNRSKRDLKCRIAQAEKAFEENKRVTDGKNQHKSQEETDDGVCMECGAIWMRIMDFRGRRETETRSI